MAWTNPTKPYNLLLDLPPQDFELSHAIYKKLIAANKYLAELKGSCLRLPNPGLLLNTIILQESKDSSEIENIVTTQDALYKAVLDPNKQINNPVKEVLRYKEAIWVGIEEIKKYGFIKSSVAIKIMQCLRGIESEYRVQPGTQLANNQNQTIYTPPDPIYIASKMAAWEKFVNDNETFDPLIKMAMMHYQFEAIHPFSDGNGRTGRILNVLYLMHAGLITQPVLYHSSYIIQHKNEYYTNLRMVTERDNWEPWIIFMLDAVAETAQTTLKFIDEMLILKEQTLAAIKQLKSKMPAYEITELLFSYPYIKIRKLLDADMGTRPTVTSYLDQLIAADILQIQKLGRENYYINHRLMDLIANIKTQ